MKIKEYKNIINLDSKFEKEKKLVLSEDNQEGIVDRLLFILENHVEKIGNIALVKGYEQKRRLLKATLNTVPPFSLQEKEVMLLDSLLQSELELKKITNTDSISVERMLGNTQLKIWQGDITTLEIDAIVNAANSAMLGCFQPLHACIDNAIHSASGVQLRDDCAKVMQLQNHAEPTGEAKITRAYNLPAQYVLHTVGPIVQNDVTPEHENLLSNSYSNCLEVASEMNTIKSVAFCCISTGVFGYPPDLAAETAIKTVMNWLEKNPNTFETIVFNVFSDRDLLIYKNILK